MRLEDVEGWGNLSRDIGSQRAHTVAGHLPPPSPNLIEVKIAYPSAGCDRTGGAMVFECIRGTGWRYVGPL